MRMAPNARCNVFREGNRYFFIAYNGLGEYNIAIVVYLFLR